MEQERAELTVEQVARRLFAAPDAGIQVLVGGLVSAIPVVNLAALGMLYRVAGSTVRGEEPAWPAWEVWTGLFRDGVRALIPVVAYGVLPLLVLGLAVHGSPWLLVPGTLALLCVAVLAVPSLVAAGVYRSASGGDLGPGEVFGLVWRARERLAVPSLALIGALVVGLPALPWVAFASWAVWFSWSASVFFSMDKAVGPSVSDRV